ncbi:efflux RND transporter periplasmic adaptor subunit [Metapseudomonas furukawaii]|jgi:membrane fusion protein (multidrug efflux system)|uniref:Membrane fusion protein of RND family multidrug efflux pump n=1 Tax=Metapseudomonas furukawaii TaxID=1149133 RepID=A0AAD1C4L7_METFU|nr:efflux RND transporter periplasmic adaptor subunit [Pseudomonas furukawaii]BAU76745.1 membrane fusion protein of RND family multidrug efflux pump [Pseudomonas furukawaii]
MPFARSLPFSLALFVAGASLPGLAGAADAPAGAPPAPEVIVETAKPAPLPLILEYAGRTAGYREVEVRAQVSGILQQRTYLEGSKVKQGQVLFRIDPRTYEAALARAKGALAQEQARYRQTERDLKRVRELQKKGYASESELDNAISNFEQSKANVEAAQAEVKARQIDLDYTTVEAPISGMTSKETRSEGSLVVAGDPNGSLLTQLTQLDPIYVNFAYPDTEAERLREGVKNGTIELPPDGLLSADLRFGDGSNYPLSGRVDFTDSFVNTGTGTVSARAVVPNPEQKLLPGMFVRVLVKGFTRPQSITVPERALAQGPRGTFVYVVDKDGIARVRQVKTGDTRDGRWVIESGVGEGDRVIVEGLPKVRPDSPVKAVEASKAPAEQAAKQS